MTQSKTDRDESAREDTDTAIAGAPSDALTGHSSHPPVMSSFGRGTVSGAPTMPICGPRGSPVSDLREITETVEPGPCTNIADAWLDVGISLPSR